MLAIFYFTSFKFIYSVKVCCYLTDFFPYPEKIDSISMPKQVRWTKNNDNTLTVIATPISNDSLPALSEMSARLPQSRKQRP